MTATQPKKPEPYSAADLMAREFERTPWIVESLLPEGLALFVASPKIGKSWIALHVAVAVCSGGSVFGRYPTSSGRVLYLDLETPPRRRKGRLGSLLGAGTPNPQMPPHRLFFADWWPTMGPGAPEVLEEWLSHNPDTRLVIVDTVAKVWPGGGPKGGGNAFYQEYHVLAGIKDVADRHGCCVLLIHHRNKGTDHEDPLNSISGTAAFQGAADSIWVAQRKRGESVATLYVTGREVIDRTLSLAWSPTTTTWEVTDDPLYHGSEDCR